MTAKFAQCLALCTALMHLGFPKSQLYADSDQQLTEKPPLVIGQGEQRLIHVPGLKRYSLGSNSIRAFPLKWSSNDRLLIKGIKPGISDLWIWKQDGSSEHRTIRIERLAKTDVSLNLLKALSGLLEVEVIFSGKGVVLRGEISSKKEASQIQAITHFYSNEIQDETEVSDSLLHASQLQLTNWIHRFHYSDNLRIEQRGKNLWVRGNLDRPSEKPVVEREMKSIFPLTHFEIETLPDYSPTVYFRVFLLELRKTQFSSFGLTWPASTKKTFQLTPGASQNLTEIDLTLQHLEGNGNAKILSNPELVVRAPGEAELFAGGELPIQTQNRFYSNVMWKNFGLTLRLKVTHWSGNRVRLEVFTEVSHLDRQLSDDRIPGIQANRMKTQVDAQFGVPLFLSGLLQQGTREEAKGLPFLRRIPVLGKLFGSEDFLNNRSELVAILYPYESPPVPSVSESPRRLPKGPLPPPRNWISPDQELEILESRDYPWNAFETGS